MERWPHHSLMENPFDRFARWVRKPAIWLLYLSAPGLLFILWRGVISIKEEFGTGAFLFFCVLGFTAMLGIASLFDARQPKDRQPPSDR